MCDAGESRYFSEVKDWLRKNGKVECIDNYDVITRDGKDQYEMNLSFSINKKLKSMFLMLND